MYGRTYHSKVLKQAEMPKQKHPFNWKRFVWIVGGILLAGAIVCLIRLPALQIKTIDIEGTDVADPEEVSFFVKEHIAGNALFIFPKGSMLLVPTATIAKKINQHFPRFKDVDVRRRGISGLIVTVSEYAGEYLWCEHETSCFFMTKEGIVFAPAPYFSGSAYLKIFGGVSKKLTFTPFTENELSMISLLQQRLATLDIQPTEYHLVSGHEVYMLFPHYGHESRLILDPANDISMALEALYTGLHTEPLASLFQAQEKVLKYIDLRFANKVVYKFD